MTDSPWHLIFLKFYHRVVFQLLSLRELARFPHCRDKPHVLPGGMTLVSCLWPVRSCSLMCRSPECIRVSGHVLFVVVCFSLPVLASFVRVFVLPWLMVALAHACLQCHLQARLGAAE